MTCAPDKLPDGERFVQEMHVLGRQQKIQVRRICPQDNALEREFIEGLSPQSNYYRFMGALPHPSESIINRLTHIDFTRDMALIATICNGSTEQPIAIARYCTEDGVDCEFAIAVTDKWQGLGIGRQLMEMLIRSARDMGYRKMFGTIYSENRRMINFVRKLGFSPRVNLNDPVITLAELDL